MADDLKYGYKGAEPTQSFGNNTGVFDPYDINNLIADNKWTTFGQLELIETQTITSSTAQVDFTNIKEDIYNVHFLTVNDLHLVSDFILAQIRLSSDGGSSFVSSGYQSAVQRGQADGSFAEDRSASLGYIRFISNVGNATNETGNAYMYLYNLGDSTKYSFTTMQSLNINAAGNFVMGFGSGVLPTATTHNAIRFMLNSGNIASVDVSLYGIKEYS